MEVELVCKVRTQEVFITLQGRKEEVDEIIGIILNAEIKIEETHIRPDILGKEICPKCKLVMDRRWLNNLYGESVYTCPKCKYQFHK